jgi:DNA-binding NarL/FixJ family response regulator
MIRIIVVDDHAVVRSGLKQILEEEADFQIVAEAANVPEMQRVLLTHPCDVLILDLGLPGRSGMDALPEVKQAYPRLRILILSMHSEDQFAIRALRSGAAGYLSKESAPDELVRAVRTVHEGSRYISTALAELLALDLVESSGRPLHELLSIREFEVLQGIASGKTISEIAQEQCLSAKTVSTYRTRVLQKLRLPSNAALVRYALTHHLVE